MGGADGDIREGFPPEQGGCKHKPLPKAGSPDQRESLRSDVQLLIQMGKLRPGRGSGLSKVTRAEGFRDYRWAVGALLPG